MSQSKPIIFLLTHMGSLYQLHIIISGFFCEVDSIYKNLMESLTFINDMSLENHQNLKHLQNAGPPKTKKLCQK